ncbi:MAG: argininosuccinate synthase [Parcubacteria group bacterium]
MEEKHKYVKVGYYEPEPSEVKKVVLLFSGGLDTSVMLKWIKDVYKAEVIALCIDIGQQADDLEEVKQKALDLGALKSIVVDAKDEFADEYIAKGIKANGSYQGKYYLSTPLGRPLLAKIAVQVAEEEKADTIAHGCTGKGNDQVRIEGTIITLNPDMKIIAPVREWGMGREEEIAYAKKHNIPVKKTTPVPYSWDDNMWGVTGEGGEIENPALIPPLNKILQVSTLPEKAPNKSELVKLEFVKGIPVSLNGKEMKLADLIIKLNKVAAKHGVGISHHLEDRVVGLKVRGIYEMPAGHSIITAHKELEKYMCTRRENKFKTLIDQEWAYLCYGGLWYEPLMDSLNAYLDKVNAKVNGTVTLRMYKGNCDVVAVKAPDALFDEKMATFMKSELFNQNAAPGFIELWTLQMKMSKRVRKNILVSIGRDEHKEQLLPYIKRLSKLKVKLYATEGTAKYFEKHGLKVTVLYKLSENKKPNLAGFIKHKRFDLIINIPNRRKKKTLTDGQQIRKQALEKDIPMVTSLDVAENTINKLTIKK